VFSIFIPILNFNFSFWIETSIDILQTMAMSLSMSSAGEEMPVSVSIAYWSNAEGNSGAISSSLFSAAEASSSSPRQDISFSSAAVRTAREV